MELLWEYLGGYAYGISRTYKRDDVRLGGDSIEEEYQDMQRALGRMLPPGPWRFRSTFTQEGYEAKLSVYVIRFA